jgi:hypothetical protein
VIIHFTMDKKTEEEYIDNFFRPNHLKDCRYRDGPPESTLKSATGGYGLRRELSESEKRKRQEEAEMYSLEAKRMKIKQENKEYEEKREEIIVKTEALLIPGTESPPQEGDADADVKLEPEFDPDDILLYNNLEYNFYKHDFDKDLKIFQYREQIVQSVSTNKITIIQGNTGCGKTTQVPQYILDEHARAGRACRIIITQPRRIAAQSVAQRVCKERNWKLGSVCGYKMRGDKRCGNDTRLFYVTTGYLLELIVHDENELDKYTHIVLDEIHERSIETDFILLLVKILLQKKKNVRVVLMSATLDAQELANYYRSVQNNIPVVKCKSKMWEVKEMHLDELENKLEFWTNISFDRDCANMADEQLDLLVRLLDFIDQKELQSSK